MRNGTKLDHSNSKLDREQRTLALREWREQVDLRAFGATCPMPQCGALAVTYEPLNSVREISGMASWEFVCGDCGAEFSAACQDLVFQSVPREWLFSQVFYA